MDAQTIKFLAPIIIGLVLGGAILWIVNIPVFQFIDQLLYGSTEEANRVSQHYEESAAEIRSRENSNVFNQIESIASGDGLYRSNYQRSWTMGEWFKAGAVVVELMIIAWLWSLIRRH